MTDLEKIEPQRALMRLPPLMTREDFDELSPRTQDHVSYMQAEWPGSDLPKECVYR